MSEVTERTVRTQPAIITAIVTSKDITISDTSSESHANLYETLSGHVPWRSEKNHKNPQYERPVQQKQCVYFILMV
jgi:hypothetical protein